MSEGGITALEEVLRLRPLVDQQRHRAPGPGRLGHRGDARGRRWPLQPRAVLPHGVGGDVRGEGTRGDERARRAPACSRSQKSPRIGGDMQWRMPFGASSASNWIAMQANAHFDRFGTTKETLGWIALNARKNAALHAVGDLQGTAHDGRLHERAHDHHAVRALRLRRAVRRRGRRDRVAQGPRRRHEAAARCTSRRSAPRSPNA